MTEPQETSFQLDRSYRIMLRELGISEHAVLRRAGLAGDLLAREAPQLPCDKYFALWDATEAEANLPDLTVRLVEGLRAEAFHPLLFAALSSSNLRIAAGRISHYKRLIAPVQLLLEHEPPTFCMQMRWLSRTQPKGSFAAFEMMFLVQLARMGTRTRIEALDVELPSPLEHPDPVEAFIGVAPRITDRAAVTLKTSDAELPFLTENAQMWEMFEPTLRRRLADLDATSSTVERVHAVLLEALPAGESSMEQVARKLATSKRTLQRRLRQEETTFQEVLNDTRESLARHYLQRTRLSGAEISYLLGFEDPNSFFRAFHHWTGQTTEEVRTAMTH